MAPSGRSVLLFLCCLPAAFLPPTTCPGYTRGQGLVSRAQAEADAKRLAAIVESFQANSPGGRCVSTTATLGSLDLNALRNEEGRGGAPPRAGCEVELYKRIKQAALLGQRVGPDQLLTMGLESCRGADGGVNFSSVVTAVHNVVRILARPENWAISEKYEPGVTAGPIELTPGKNLSGWKGMMNDPVFPILQDVGGTGSVDGNPPLGQKINRDWEKYAAPKIEAEKAQRKADEAELARLDKLIAAEKADLAQLESGQAGWRPGQSGAKTPTQNQEEGQRRRASIARLEKQRSDLSAKLQNPTRYNQARWIQDYFFDLNSGVFSALPGAEEAEGNGGCAYYYWLGAVVKANAGQMALDAGKMWESGQKYLFTAEQEYARGLVQISYFEAGGVLADAVADAVKKCEAKKAAPKPPPKQYGQLTDAEKASLFGCLCPCTGGYALGTYVAYKPQPVGTPGSTCADVRNGPCLYSGAGCWRAYPDTTNECARKCFEQANVDPQSTREALQKEKEKNLDDFLDEALKTGLFPYYPSPEPRYPRLKKYVDEDMAGKALALADQAAKIDPGRKAKAEQVKFEVARNMPAWAPDLVRELDFERAEKLLNRAVQMGDPTGVARKNLGDVARWRKDWDGIQDGARRVDGLLGEYRACEANDYYVKQVQPLVMDFNLVAPPKDQLVKDLNGRLSRASNDCITQNNVPQIQQRILDAQKAGNESLVADECRRALALKTLCDCQRVQYEKLLGQAEAGLKAKQDTLNARAQKLVDQGKAQEARGDLAGAIQSYDGARQIRPSPELDAHIRDLQAALDRKKQEEARRDQAARWVQEGQVRERASNYPAAIDCYQRALQILPNPEVEARIRYLQDQMKQHARQAQQQAEQQQKLARAKALTDEGMACEKRGDLAGALSRYQQADQIAPNTQVEQHIRQLQAEIARRDQAAKQGQGSRPPSAPVQPPSPPAGTPPRTQTPPPPSQQPAQGLGAFRASGEWPVTKDGAPAKVAGAMAVTGTRVEGTLTTRGEDPDGGGIRGIVEMTFSGTYNPATGHMQGSLGRDVKATYYYLIQNGQPSVMHFVQEGTWEADLGRDGSITGAYRGRWDDPETPVRFEFPMKMRMER